MVERVPRLSQLTWAGAQVATSAEDRHSLFPRQNLISSGLRWKTIAELPENIIIAVIMIMSAL